MDESEDTVLNGRIKNAYECPGCRMYYDRQTHEVIGPIKPGTSETSSVCPTHFVLFWLDERPRDIIIERFRKSFPNADYETAETRAMIIRENRAASLSEDESANNLAKMIQGIRS